MALRATSVETEIGLLPEMMPPDPGPRPPTADRRLELLYVGRITATKGLRFAIEAVAALPQPSDVVLRVVGDGEAAPQCEALARNLGIGELVDFRGWVSPEDVSAFYAAADVFVFPSVREPSGSVVLEAMSHGLPVVTCNYGGPGFVVDDSCGMRVPVDGPEALVAGLTKAIRRLQQPAIRSAMGEAARVRCVDSFGWSAKSERIDALYRQVVASR
jgi:glycosyltransferase involved in cell wall biosynthesis